MKLLDIALKDLRRNVRNAFFLVFGLGLPLLTAVLFYFAFGGMGSDETSFELATIQVQVANQDQEQGGFSAGQLLLDILRDAIPDLIEVTEAPDAASARAAVDRQEAAVAVIVPAGFTAAIFAPQGRAAVQIYQDPTLTIGPAIVKGLVEQLVDGFAGSKIATATAYSLLREKGIEADAATLQAIAMQYANWSATAAQGQQGSQHPLFDVQSPGGGEVDGADEMTTILGLVMAGMMVFYVFFTGAAAAQSIIQEEEQGTLPRLFTTPTAESTILGGKLVSIFVLLVLQVVTLVVVSSLVFRIPWGEPLPVALVTLGLVVLSGSFGTFLISFLKNSRQAGIIFGGVMTVMGMIAMASVFTAGVPGAENPMETASLFVPQGWAVRGWKLLLEGGGTLTGSVLVTVAVMLGLGLVFFVIGLLRFRKRFA